MELKEDLHSAVQSWIQKRSAVGLYTTPRHGEITTAQLSPRWRASSWSIPITVSRKPHFRCRHWIFMVLQLCPSMNPALGRYGVQPRIQSETLWYHCLNSTHGWYQNALLMGSYYYVP